MWRATIVSYHFPKQQNHKFTPFPFLFIRSPIPMSKSHETFYIPPFCLLLSFHPLLNEPFSLRNTFLQLHKFNFHGMYPDYLFLCSVATFYLHLYNYISQYPFISVTFASIQNKTIVMAILIFCNW